jgi:hypothetical protein
MRMTRFFVLRNRRVVVIAAGGGTMMTATRGVRDTLGGSGLV